MTALLLKDLRVLRPWWWLIVPGHVLFAANGIISPESFFGMNAALAWAYTVVLLIIDWTQDADRFVASLPVSRADVVKARYAGALGAAVGATVLYALYGQVLLSLGTERLLKRWPDTRGWESAGGLLTFFLVVWLVTVVYLPFYFRAGLGRGSFLFAVTSSPLIVGGALLVPRGLIPWIATSVVETVGSGLAAILAVALAAAVGWLSLHLAMHAFDRRDL